MTRCDKWLILWWTVTYNKMLVSLKLMIQTVLFFFMPLLYNVLVLSQKFWTNSALKESLWDCYDKTKILGMAGGSGRNRRGRRNYTYSFSMMFLNFVCVVFVQPRSDEGLHTCGHARTRVHTHHTSPTHSSLKLVEQQWCICHMKWQMTWTHA